MNHKDYVYSVSYSPAFGFEVTKGGLFDEDEHRLDDSDLELPRKWVAISESLIEQTHYTHHIEFELFVIEQGSECVLEISGKEPDVYGFDDDEDDWMNDGSVTLHLTTIKQSYPDYIMTGVINAIANEYLARFN